MRYIFTILLLLLSTSGKLQQTNTIPRPVLEEKLDNFNSELNQLKDEIYSNSTFDSAK